MPFSTASLIFLIDSATLSGYSKISLPAINAFKLTSAGVRPRLTPRILSASVKTKPLKPIFILSKSVTTFCDNEAASSGVLSSTGTYKCPVMMPVRLSAMSFRNG